MVLGWHFITHHNYMRVKNMYIRTLKPFALIRHFLMTTHFEVIQHYSEMF